MIAHGWRPENFAFAGISGAYLRSNTGCPACPETEAETETACFQYRGCRYTVSLQFQSFPLNP